MKIYNFERERKLTEEEAAIETQKVKDEITEARIRIDELLKERDRLDALQDSYRNTKKKSVV